MGLLNWQKKPKFEQGDLDYITRVLLGEVELKVKVVKYLGDINQKIYTDTGEALPKEPHVIYRPSKIERKNWGDCYRACQRLVRCGYLDSFTLRQDGTLKVKFSDNDKIVSRKSIAKLIPINTYNSQYLQPSIVNELKRFKDTKHDKRVINSILNPHSKKYVPKKFVPYDFAPPRIEVEARIRQDLRYLHSEEARLERVRNMKEVEKAGGATDLWGEKFKMKGESYFSRPILSTPFSQTFKQHCMNRGYCIWPSPIYITH